jgi:glycosyltransferase involved in cell wall biosynthesis
MSGLPVRLIHFASYKPPYSGSFVPMVREVLLRAQARGWDAAAVFPEEARGRDWANLLAEEVEVSFRPPTRAAVEEVLSAGKTTILHTHFTKYDLPATFVARTRPQTHVIWHVRAFLPKAPARRLRSMVKYTLARRYVDAMVCVGPHLVDDLVRRGASSRQTIYLPNGIDTTRFRPASPAARAGARAALGLPRDRPVLLHYGWSWHVKGGDIFCAAVGELLRRGVKVAAVTVGAGAEAEADAQRFGITEELVRVPQSEGVEQLLAAADVLVLPSRAEGGDPPLAVLECLAAGVPVVAGQIPGQSLGHQLSAYRTVPLQPGAVADGIQAQLNTPGEARSAARAYVEGERSLAAWANRMHAVYDSILSRNQLPGSAPTPGARPRGQ